MSLYNTHAPASVRRLSSVARCPSHVLHHFNFQSSSSPKQLGQSKLINGPGHMTKMAATHIYTECQKSCTIFPFDFVFWIKIDDCKINYVFFKFSLRCKARFCKSILIMFVQSKLMLMVHY